MSEQETAIAAAWSNANLYAIWRKQSKSHDALRVLRWVVPSRLICHGLVVDNNLGISYANIHSIEQRMCLPRQSTWWANTQRQWLKWLFFIQDAHERPLMLTFTHRVAVKLSRPDEWHTLRDKTRNLSASSQISCKLSDGWRVTQDGSLPCSPTGLLVYMNLSKTESALALTSSAFQKCSRMDAILIDFFRHL